MSDQVVAGLQASNPTTNNAGLAPGSDAACVGRIIGIRGGVVDVLFPRPSPRIQDLVHAGDLALEVASLLDNGAVRCMALAPVRGLGLGMPVQTTG
ncbi:MAG: F0F1 ATP synthase subunit beta, partial [Pseudomonadales bacterium]